jgi:hypothetical protein
VYDVDYSQPNKEFIECWKSAFDYLSQMIEGKPAGFLKSSIENPSTDHVSFGMGNQLFHVRFEDVDGEVFGPGNIDGLRVLSEKTGGHACILWMQKFINLETKEEGWKPVHEGWALTRLGSVELIDPEDFVTDDKIEISDWELYDVALIYLIKQIEQRGMEVTSWLHWDADLVPSLWFREGEQVEWAIVRATRYPEHGVPVPDDYDAVQAHLAEKGFPIGNFVSVSVASADDPFDEDAKRNGNYRKLYRGEPYVMKVTYPIIANQRTGQ